ncbi:hypothetical protein FHW64_004071 [Variovorax sp. Sphag1AA]|nr:hypothetical protein [Variovorax sp. Sphag1AA]
MHRGIGGAKRATHASQIGCAGQARQIAHWLGSPAAID